jgi:hypothetical protein
MVDRDTWRAVRVLLPALLVLGCTTLPGASTEPAATADATPPSQAVAVVPGCSVPELPADTPPDHAEVVGQRGSPIYPPLQSLGMKVESLADDKLSAMAPVELKRSPDGLPVQAILFDANRDVDDSDSELNPQITTVFAKDPFGPHDTFLEVLGGGGAIFQQAVSAGVDAALVKGDDWR